MYKVVGVKLKLTNDIHYFDASKVSVKKGDNVIVKLEKVEDFGKCVTDVIEKKKEELYFPLKKVLRKATKEDIKKNRENIIDAEKALIYAKKILKQYNINMHLIEAYYTFEKEQLYFLFTADERVDFRELAKKLAQKYKTRIELRQIGVRDKAKIVGGIGPCGLFLCCNSFLTEFNSVSINMAKNQFLSLNPSKINGVCGRLLCCLNYENDVYTNLKQGFPEIGEVVSIEQGKGKVVSLDVLKNTYKVQVDSNVYEIRVDRNGKN